MKICPQCNAQYEDLMFFCLEDGNPLRSTDISVQSNPVTFENTLTLPTDEKTITLPNQNDQSGEKTLTLPPDAVTEQKFTETGVWQPETIAPQPIPIAKTNENVVLSSYVDSNQNSGKGKFIIIGLLFGGIALIGTALGGWWLLQKPADDVAVSNVNKQPQSTNKDLGLSNANLSVAFGQDNSNNSNSSASNTSNSNLNNSLNLSPNKSTPTPSPTKDSKESPTPKPSQTSTPMLTPQSTSTPIPKTPTPTPIPTQPPPNKIVNGGVMNGKAVNLVKPSYPPAARAVRASGSVGVQVTIDENGNVISASAISGHALLRAAAEQAARSSKFSPTILSGQKVKVTGVIVYNFTTQ